MGFLPGKTDGNKCQTPESITETFLSVFWESGRGMTLLEISFLYQLYFCFHSCVLQEDLFAVKLSNSSLKNYQLFGNVLLSNEPGAWAQPVGSEAPWFLWDSCRRTLNFLLAEACGFTLEQKGNLLVKGSLGLHFRLGLCAVQVAGSMPKCYFCWSLSNPDVFLLYPYLSRFIQLLIQLVDCSREFLLLKVCFSFRNCFVMQMLLFVISQFLKLLEIIPGLCLTLASFKL